MDSGVFLIAADPAVLWHLLEVTTRCQKAAEGITFLHLRQLTVQFIPDPLAVEALH